MSPPRLSLTYGNVESLTAQILHVPQEQTSKLRARFKQLKRLGFPPGVNVSAGRRFEYDLFATMGCVTAFSLIRAMLLPQQAVHLLTSNWAEVTAEIAQVVASLSFDGEGQVDIERRPDDSRYLVVVANALGWTEPGAIASGTEPTAQVAAAILVSGLELRQQLGSGAGSSMPPPRLIVDLWATIAAAANIVVERGWATAGELKNAAE